MLKGPIKFISTLERLIRYTIRTAHCLHERGPKSVFAISIKFVIRMFVTASFHCIDHNFDDKNKCLFNK